MQEKGKLDLNCEVKLSFEKPELLLFRTEREAIVVKSNFTKCCGRSGLLGGKCERLEFLKESRGTAGVSVECLGRTWMDPNGSVTKTTWGFR